MTLYEKVMNRTRKEGGCLVFTGTRQHGYGYVSTKKGRLKRAHRVVWKHHHGPTNLNVCHHCDNPACVNIEHLFAGTQKDNMRDCAQKGRTNRPHGEKNPQARLTQEQVDEIRRAGLQGESQRSIDKRFGVHHTHVGDILRGDKW